MTIGLPKYNLRKRKAYLSEPSRAKRIQRGPRSKSRKVQPAREQCLGRTRNRQRCTKTMILEKTSHCPCHPLELPEIPPEILCIIFEFCFPAKPVYLPLENKDFDRRVAAADCLAVLGTNRHFSQLATDLVSSRLSANFTITESGRFGCFDQTNIFESPRPPLLKNLRFQIVLNFTLNDHGRNQAQCLKSTFDMTTWIRDLREIQLDFEVGVDWVVSSETVLEVMRDILSAVVFPPGPALRITAYHQASALRIFPLDGVSTSKENFEKWVSTSARRDRTD